VNQALIENAQHDEDRQQRGDDQNRQRRQRLLISLRVPAKKPRTVEGMPSRCSIWLTSRVASLSDMPVAS
jgi:hypothetical protein